MAKRYLRKLFIERLRCEIEEARAILMTSAGSGICAKLIERGGADILGIYNTGYFRMHGHGSLAGMLPMLDANQLVFDMARKEILPQVREVPVVMGVNGVDVLRDMGQFLSECCSIGISGVHNFPTVAWFDGEFRRTLEETGLGYDNEIRMLRIARELDLLTVGYAFNEADTRRLMNDASPDIFIYHAGITRGGATGYCGGSGIEETAARSQRHFEIARSINPDVILLAHGAAISTPDDAAYMFGHTSCQGVQLGSSIERLAIEGPLEYRTRQFKDVGPLGRFGG